MRHGYRTVLTLPRRDRHTRGSGDGLWPWSARDLCLFNRWAAFAPFAVGVACEAEGMGMSILPVRPLPVSKDFSRATLLAIPLLVFGLAATIGGAGYGIVLGHGVWADQRLWSRGVPAQWTQVEGTESTHRWIARTYELRVQWRGRDGIVHEQPIEFATFLGSVDQGAEPQVRYDPNAPNKIALSWAVDLAPWRWLMNLVMIGLLGCVVGPSLLLLAWRMFREWHTARAA